MKIWYLRCLAPGSRPHIRHSDWGLWMRGAALCNWISRKGSCSLWPDLQEGELLSVTRSPGRGAALCYRISRKRSCSLRPVLQEEKLLFVTGSPGRGAALCYWISRKRSCSLLLDLQEEELLFVTGSEPASSWNGVQQCLADGMKSCRLH